MKIIFKIFASLIATMKKKLNEIWTYLGWLYTQYSLITALNILDASEALLFNCTLLLVMMTCAFSAYTYMPNQIYSFYQFFQKKFMT